VDLSFRISTFRGALLLAASQNPAAGKLNNSTQPHRNPLSPSSGELGFLLRSKNMSLEKCHKYTNPETENHSIF